MSLADTTADALRAMTEACALVDRSERGKLALTGGEAKEFLHGQVSNDIEGLESGSNTTMRPASRTRVPRRIPPRARCGSP